VAKHMPGCDSAKTFRRGPLAASRQAQPSASCHQLSTRGAGMHQSNSLVAQCFACFAFSYHVNPVCCALCFPTSSGFARHTPFGSLVAVNVARYATAPPLFIGASRVPYQAAEQTTSVLQRVPCLVYSAMTTAKPDGCCSCSLRTGLGALDMQPVQRRGTHARVIYLRTGRLGST
jgi:hypothetical protein